MESENSKKARALVAGAHEHLEGRRYGYGELDPKELLPARELLTMAMLILEVPAPKREPKPAAERGMIRKKKAIARRVRAKFSRPKPAAPPIAADE